MRRGWCPATPENFKLTWPADFALAERLLRSRGSRRPPCSRRHDARVCASAKAGTSTRWSPGRPLVLGGVRSRTPTACVGHSDADALLHAHHRRAVRRGGARRHRPPLPRHRARFRRRRLAPLLHEAARTGARSGLGRSATSTARSLRRRRSWRRTSRRCAQRIAEALGVAPDAVNVKAKTAERLGPVGEGRAIEARAVCLLQREPGILLAHEHDD